jgi:hypothetical protein
MKAILVYLGRDYIASPGRSAPMPSPRHSASTLRMTFRAADVALVHAETIARRAGCPTAGERAPSGPPSTRPGQIAGPAA